jgi:succinate-semialdehyde dehydrogenase/glutarate-semialdehyde dehydrogenase
MLLNWFQLLLAHADDLARILTVEQRKPLSESRAELRYGASFIEWFAQEARRICGNLIPTADNNNRYLVIE